MNAGTRSAGAESHQSADTQQRKHRVLSQGIPSVTRTIADAVVLKDGDLFLITAPDGRLPEGGGHGLGLYYHDCRYLRTYELRLQGALPTPLGVTVAAGDRGSVQLTNPELEHTAAGALPRDTIDLEWDRALAADSLSLVDTLTVRNWGHDPAELALELRFDSGFEDVFDVRGLLDESLGTLHPPAWEPGLLRFAYDGKDGRFRSLTVALPPIFTSAKPGTANATLRLAPREVQRLELRLVVRESDRCEDVMAVESPQPRGGGRVSTRGPRAHPWPGGATFASESAVVGDTLDRSLADLRLLRSSLDGRTFIAAGIPWFATLFGRDSLVAALQLLPHAPNVARDTLRLLAQYQADQVDEWRDASPGKILHELRVGEMARAGAIPHSPYYGSVDATPLFLIVLEQYVAWTGDLALFDELSGHVQRALEWIDCWGDRDGDGYVEYRSRSEHGLINQGWKDSGDAIVDEQGRIATPPIALVEVQAYVFAAKRAVAALHRRRGDEAGAARREREAEELRHRFEQDFWLEPLGCYAMALEAQKRPLAVVSSNAGHALWCGIAAPDRAGRVARALMADDMFSGWGVRTLSERCQGYNPIAYHLGTVWPHDNAFIAAGLVRYGFAAEARRIFDGVVEAAMDFEHRRLPELWTGFSRARYATPIRYPVACHPQAWAAGALPFLLRHLLGLEPSALDRRLRIVRPTLPSLGSWIELRRVRVGDGAVDLRFERTGDDRAATVHVLGTEGELEVEVVGSDDERGGAA